MDKNYFYDWPLANCVTRLLAVVPPRKMVSRLYDLSHLLTSLLLRLGIERHTLQKVVRDISGVVEITRSHGRIQSACYSLMTAEELNHIYI